MRIEVTEEDIRNGLRWCCFACPVALAIARTLRRPGFAVDGSGIVTYTNPRNEAVRVPVPQADMDRMARWILEFDYSEAKKADTIPKPFSFELGWTGPESAQAARSQPERDPEPVQPVPPRRAQPMKPEPKPQEQTKKAEPPSSLFDIWGN